MNNESALNKTYSQSKLLTIAGLIAAIIFAFLMLFPWTNFLAKIVINSLDPESRNGLFIVDAIISFINLYIFFTALTFFKRIHSTFIIFATAIVLFLYWGIESEFFWNGINPMYPMWYEINMAINDIAAALIVVYLNKHITTRFTLTR